MRYVLDCSVALKWFFQEPLSDVATRLLEKLQRPRPLLRLARPGRETRLAAALNAEEWAERRADARYWAPLRTELERLAWVGTARLT